MSRAVIGGLTGATIATLIVLPTVFAIVQGSAGRVSASLDPADPDSPYYEVNHDATILDGGIAANGRIRNSGLVHESEIR